MSTEAAHAPKRTSGARVQDEAWFAAAELHKLELLLNVATLGYAALWLDIDSIVFRNPLPHLLSLGADLALPDARCVARPDDAAPAERPAPRGGGVSLDQASGARPPAARPPLAAPCERSGRAVLGHCDRLLRWAVRWALPSACCSACRHWPACRTGNRRGAHVPQVLAASHVLLNHGKVEGLP